MDDSSNKRECAVTFNRIEDTSTTIVGMCQMDHTMRRDVFDAMQFNIVCPRDLETCTHSFHCGSSAEFYIRPINSCIDDLDFLTFQGNYLVFLENIPVLPDDCLGLVDTICCLQIVPYTNYPGYVMVKYLGTMVYNWHCKKFQFHKIETPYYLAADYTPLKLFHRSETDIKDPAKGGPAIRTIADNTDFVPSFWCPQWPKEAHDWPFRQRKNGWPATDNIRKIIHYGCHVVFAKHPECRGDEKQWRLSFSCAELCLLQSWTPVQQIVYHMLRFLAKKELINKDCRKKDEVLCTYHIKTLMLWSCEEMSSELWNYSSVVEICCNLFRKLSDWLEKGYCPNYFIPQANLLHKGLNQKIVHETIKRLNEFCNLKCLNEWFVANYITPILYRVVTFEDAIEPEIDVGYCMLRIYEAMNAGKVEKFDSDFTFGFCCSATQFIHKHTLLDNGYKFHSFMERSFCQRHRVTTPGDRTLFTCTSNVEFSSKFPEFLKALFILHSSRALGLKEVTYESELFTELIREVSWQPRYVKSKYHNFPKSTLWRLGRSYAVLLKAQDLMENLTGLNRPHEFRLLSQLSKDFLQNSILYDDLKSHDIRSVALVYLAALHFSESDYETVIKLSSTCLDIQTSGYDNDEMVVKGVREEYADEEDTLNARCLPHFTSNPSLTSNHPLVHYEKVKETLNAGCLLYIDDVAEIIGLYLLFRRIHDNFQYYRRRYLLDLQVLPEVFAHYLITSSNERKCKVLRQNYDLKHPQFPMDKMLTAVTRRKFYVLLLNSASSDSRVYQRADPINDMETYNKSYFTKVDNVIQLLMEYSLQNITSFYDGIYTEFGIHCNTVDCYRAAYLYKCRKYPEVLQLCEKILNELYMYMKMSMEKISFANVMVMPPLDSYFDTDIQCLLGLDTLVCYLSPLNENLCQLPYPVEPTFQHMFAREIYSANLSLSEVFRYPHFMRSRYFIGRHFLASYLTTRSLLDLNHPQSEVMLEFKKLESHLPFEHIIYRFLHHKLRELHYLTRTKDTMI